MAGLVGTSVVVAVLIFAVVLPAIVDKTSDAGKGKIAARYAKDDIVLEDSLANSFGLESLGATQVRGNGALVLTKTTLHFFQAVPERDVEIPLARIDEVGITRAHLGKTAGVDLLHVAFRDPVGKLDSIAWVVRPDAETWRTKLRELTGK